MTLSGFEADGDQHPDNTPQDSYILKNRPMKAWMTWNPSALKAATKDMIESLGHQVTASTAPRSDNTYICNNVSYVVLEAIQGAHLSLAGGLLRMNPDISPTTKAGFFHFPAYANNSPEDVAVWVKVLAKIIDVSV
jgi:pyrrolidone-carboxylate peptidase